MVSPNNNFRRFFPFGKRLAERNRRQGQTEREIASVPLDAKPVE